MKESFSDRIRESGCAFYQKINTVKLPFHPLFIWAALWSPCCVLAQADFAKVDAHARSVPFPERQNVAQLTRDLVADLKTEKEKARAIYAWIADHIHYDLKTGTDNHADAEVVLEKQKPAAVLKSGKAICEGYSNLFSAMCAAAGLTGITASGYSKNDDGKVRPDGHAWNLVRADGVWGLIDVTWGAGAVDEKTGKYRQKFNERYFFVSPEVFIADHYPDDPLFQLLANPIDFQEFKQSPERRAATSSSNAKEKTPLFPALSDSLDQFAALDSNARTLNSCLRILRFDPNNGTANFELALRQYNQAAAFFNQFQSDMNALVKSKKQPTRAMLQQCDTYLRNAETALEQAQQMLSRIRSGDKYYPSATTLRKDVKAKLTFCSDAKKRNSEMMAKAKG